MNKAKKWFLAELVFRLHDRTDPSIKHFDKHYRPLTAATLNEAYQLALITASQELDKRLDYTKEYLEWEFIGLSSLVHIREGITPNEYHTVMTVPDDVAGFISSLKWKSMKIQTDLLRATA